VGALAYCSGSITLKNLAGLHHTRFKRCKFMAFKLEIEIPQFGGFEVATSQDSLASSKEAFESDGIAFVEASSLNAFLLSLESSWST
jgi:hypothetical protein